MSKGEQNFTQSKAEGIVPELRFPKFENTQVWNSVRLDSLVDVIDGDRGVNYPKLNDFSEEGYCLFMNAKNVTKQGFLFEETQFITREKDELLRKGKLNRNDIVLTTRGSVGQFAFFSDKILFDHLRINSGMVILRVADDYISPNYLYKYCTSQVITSEINNLAFGNAQQQLTVSIIKKLPLLYPKDKLEQQKIADCLSSLDDLIGAETEKLECLKDHKKGLLQQLFPAEGETVPKLRFPEFENDGEWEVKIIEEVAEITTGNKDTQDRVENGIYPFFVRSQTIERINTFSFDGEAILTSGDGVGVGKIYHYLIGKFDFHQRVYCIYNFKKDICGKFIFYYFSEYFYRRVMQLSAKNSVDSVRRAMITKMPIYIPCFSEQEKIADCLSSTDESINAQSERIQFLKDHKKGLMQQLFPNLNENGK